MAYKTFCDECEREIDLTNQVRIDLPYHLPSGFEMCYTCFNKHWRPIKKKFSIKRGYANKIRH